MILGLRDQGIGVLLSSHQLSDIELIADHLVIIQKGEVTHRVSMDEIHQGQGQAVVIKTTDNEKAQELLQRAGFEYVQRENGHLVITSDERATIAQVIVAGDVGLLQMTTKQNSLEDVFLEWTEEGGL